MWLALLAAAVALSVLAAVNDTLPGDEGITSWLQDRSFPGETLSSNIRTITHTEVVLVIGAASAVALWFRGYRREAAVLVIGMVALVALLLTVKGVVDRPRPDPAVFDQRAEPRSPSFPSGHVTSAIFLYGFLVYLSLKLAMAPVARVVLIGLAVFIIGMSPIINVYLGVHWPSDVLGSIIWSGVLLMPLLLADRLLPAAVRLPLPGR